MAAPKTLMDPDNPLSGRLRFRCRTLNNWLLAAIIYSAWVLVFALFPFRLVADAVGLAVLVFLVFYVLEARVIKIRCPACLRILLTNTPWVCGFCGAKNQHADDFPFVHRCEQCSAEPRAYKCHHCGELIHLTEDALRANYASCLNSPIEPKEEDLDRATFDNDRRHLEYKVQLQKLTNELNVLQKAGEMQKPKSPEEKIEASWAKRRAFTVAAGQIYKREKSANAVNFKDDKEMQAWADEALDDWYKSGEWERISI